jgi:peptidoglycan/LPS O-acetylase OafA/YrhL
MGGELRALTSLRLVAALAVFLHHFGVAVYPQRAHSLWQAFVVEGHEGVTIFFVLSGFLIAHRYGPALEGGRFDWRDYLLKRFARVYPLYAVILALTLGLGGEAANASPVWVSWGLAQGYFVGWLFSGVPTAWSLTVEGAFYLVAPVIIGTVVRRSWGLLLFWLLAGPLVGALLVDVIATTALPDYGGMLASRDYLAFTLFGRLPQFVLGIGAALVYRRWAVSWWRHPRGAWLAGGLLAVAVAGYLWAVDTLNASGGALVERQYDHIVGAAVALGILALTHPTMPVSRVLAHRWPVYGGRISYALYLVQLSPLFPALLLSAALYEGIERPAHRLLVAGRSWHLPRPGPLSEPIIEAATQG